MLTGKLLLGYLALPFILLRYGGSCGGPSAGVCVLRVFSMPLPDGRIGSGVWTECVLWGHKAKVPTINVQKIWIYISIEFWFGSYGMPVMSAMSAIESSDDCLIKNTKLNARIVFSVAFLSNDEGEGLTAELLEGERHSGFSYDIGIGLFPNEWRKVFRNDTNILVLCCYEANLLSCTEGLAVHCTLTK